jgi:DNA-directed RNA polymerase specialized sigma24 family protein
MAKKRNIPIPSNIFIDRSISVLEAIVKYLKEKKGLTYHEIAVLLNRDDRTIWTVYQRARKKNAK